MGKIDPKRATALEYLAAAKRDIDMLSSNIDNPMAADELMGFLAQQTIEKAIKGIFIVNGIHFTKTHDLFNLLELCKENDIKAPVLSHNPEYLTRFAVEMRYMKFYDEEIEVDKHALLDDARTFYNWAEKGIGE